jgi:hypothetical protein
MDREEGKNSAQVFVAGIFENKYQTLFLQPLFQSIDPFQTSPLDTHERKALPHPDTASMCPFLVSRVTVGLVYCPCWVELRLEMSTVLQVMFHLNTFILVASFTNRADCF